MRNDRPTGLYERNPQCAQAQRSAWATVLQPAPGVRSPDVGPVSPLVLVIEDDDEVRDLVEERLLDGGYRVSTAIHGAEALERVHQEPPDLILLDMDMPVMGGRAFVRAYEDSSGPHALIIVLAAIGADREATQRETAGHSPKPFDVEPLLRLVQRVRPVRGQVTRQTPGR